MLYLNFLAKNFILSEPEIKLGSSNTNEFTYSMENIEKHNLLDIEKEKPPFLYHASQNKNIEELKPQAISFRDPKEGAVVFASPDYALVTTFLIKTDESWTQIGKNNKVPYIIINDREHFMERDKGGTIYKLPNTSFNYDPGKGMGEYEWISREPIKPIEKKDYGSALEAMIENGVQVYFVDKKTFDELERTEKGEDYVKLLKGLESENQKRGKNVLSFENEDEE